MSEKDMYINMAELKRKVRAWFNYRQAAKSTVEDFMKILDRLPKTVKGELETTLEVSKNE